VFLIAHDDVCLASRRLCATPSTCTSNVTAPSPLPPNPYPQDLNPEAYDHCLQTQVEAGDDAELLMYARCLGFLIIEAPNIAARDFISHEINECQGDRSRFG